MNRRKNNLLLWILCGGLWALTCCTPAAPSAQDPDFAKQLGLGEQYQAFLAKAPGQIQAISEAGGKLYFSIRSFVFGPPESHQMAKQGNDGIMVLDLATRAQKYLYPPSPDTQIKTVISQVAASQEFLAWTEYTLSGGGVVPSGSLIKCMDLKTNQVRTVKEFDSVGQVPFLTLSDHTLFFDDFIRGEQDTNAPPFNLEGTVTEFDLDSMKPTKVFSEEGASLFYPMVEGERLVYTKYSQNTATAVVWNLSTQERKEYHYDQSIWEPSLGDGILYVKANPHMVGYGRILKMPLASGVFSPILSDDQSTTVGFLGVTPEPTDFAMAWFRTQEYLTLPVYVSKTGRFVALDLHNTENESYIVRLVGKSAGYLYWAGDLDFDPGPDGGSSISFIAGVYQR